MYVFQIIKCEGLPSVPFEYLKKEGVTSTAVDVGGAKLENNIFCKRKCHFGTTYIDGITGDPHLYFGYSKGTSMRACARFHENIIAG